MYSRERRNDGDFVDMSVDENTLSFELLPGEEGGDGKVVYIRRGRVALRGAQIEEEVLFPNLTGPSIRPEGSFKSNGSSNDNMASGCSSPPVERKTG